MATRWKHNPGEYTLNFPAATYIVANFWGGCIRGNNLPDPEVEILTFNYDVFST